MYTLTYHRAANEVGVPIGDCMIMAAVTDQLMVMPK
jgi:hypothetical protein